MPGVESSWKARLPWCSARAAAPSMAPSARTTHSDNSWLFFIYVFSMGHWVLVLPQKTVRDFKAKDFGMEGHLVAGLYLLCATLFVSLSRFAPVARGISMLATLFLSLCCFAPVAKDWN